jgi:hypothetical protein
MNSTNNESTTSPRDTGMCSPSSTTVIHRSEEILSTCCLAPFPDYPEDDICPKCLNHSHPDTLKSTPKEVSGR